MLFNRVTLNFIIIYRTVGYPYMVVLRELIEKIDWTTVIVTPIERGSILWVLQIDPIYYPLVRPRGPVVAIISTDRRTKIFRWVIYSI